MNRGDFVAALGRHSIEASLLVGLVLVVQWIFRKQLGPQWSCALWLIVAVRLLPISVPSGLSLFNWLPEWGTSLASATAFEQRGRQKQAYDKVSPREAAPQPASAAAEAPAVWQRPISTLASPSLTAVSSGTVSRRREWLFRVWLAGALLLGFYVVGSNVPLARRIARLRPLQDTMAGRILEECRVQLGLRSSPVLCEFAGVTTPALHGLFRPRLLLPIGFTNKVSTDELRFVFMHELAHIRRRDLMLNWFAAALLLLHWFNPIVWLSFARWRVDREIASDAMAIGAAGASQRLPYGRTMLRLLEDFPVQASGAGLLGIFESKAALRRRIKMIAAPRSTQKPIIAIGILAALALVGLTDAQVNPGTASRGFVDATSPLLTPHLRGESVVFLVQASESMLGQTAEEVARRRGDAEALKRAAPKWVQVARGLQSLLEALAPGTRFQVLLFNDEILTALPEGVIGSATPGAAVTRAVRQIESTVPAGGVNLELAFATARDLPIKADRLVLLTDGFLGVGVNVPVGSVATGEKQRSLFDAARKQLPARVPLTTVLLPYYYGDPWAPALFWELANATRGVLVSPANLGPSQRVTEISHIAVVVDTSGSMRNFKTERLWPIVIRMVEEILAANPRATHLQILDAGGRSVMGRADHWLPFTPETVSPIREALGDDRDFSESNPLPGITQALRATGLNDPAPGSLAVYVLGDEFSQDADAALKIIDQLNPRDVSGNRRAVINAIGFPTTIKFDLSMGNTGLKFANFMRRLTHEHGGTFIALKDL